MLTGKQEMYYKAIKNSLVENGYKVMKEDDKYLYIDPSRDLNDDILDMLKAINTTLYYHTGMKIKVRKKLVK